jgi:excisionase family DNA binding protein
MNFLYSSPPQGPNQPHSMPVSFEQLLSADTAGRMLSIHPVTLLRWAREGRVPHRRLGRRVVFRASELDLWLASLNGTIDAAA